jgi:hypothetical protein
MNDINTPSTTGLSDSTERTGYRLQAIPLASERNLNWPDRLAQWRQLRDAPLHAEDKRAAAARRSERLTRRMVSVHHSTEFGHVFSNKRIPRDVTAAAMGRYEADLIVITPRRLVNLEVKNWSGKLKVQGDRWVQVQRSGNEVAHNNLLAYNRDKLRALHRYLMHCGVNLPQERFHQAVVFANPWLDLDPALANHPAVLRLDDLHTVLGGGTSAARHMAAKLVELLSKAETAAALSENLFKVIPPAQVKSVAGAIERLRTWDRLTLRGGRILQGDILWMRITGVQIPAAVLTPGGEATLSWRRGLVGGFAWVALNSSAGSFRGNVIAGQDRISGRTLPLNPQDCVYFHEPGEAAPSVIALSHVERMQIG